jgi:hypothetical protein
MVGSFDFEFTRTSATRREAWEGNMPELLSIASTSLATHGTELDRSIRF